MRVSVGKLVDLPDGRGVRVEAAGHRVAVFRIADSVDAIGHRGTPAVASPAGGGLFGGDFGGAAATTSLGLSAIVLDQIKVAFVPGEAFGAPGYARFSFALADDDLVEGLGRLTEFFG